MKTENQNETKPKSKKGLLAFFLIVAFVVAGILIFNSCQNNEPTLLTRKATLNDIYLDTSEDIALSINYTMIPNVDIKNLEITFKYYDTNKKLISTKIKNIGNVKKGIQYKISVSLGEFSILDLFKITHTGANVTNGTVSYFQ